MALSEKEAFLEKLLAFKHAALDLDRAWEAMQQTDSSCDLGVANYPFNHDFGDVTCEIVTWHETAAKQLEEILQENL